MSADRPLTEAARALVLGSPPRTGGWLIGLLEAGARGGSDAKAEPPRDRAHQDPVHVVVVDRRALPSPAAIGPLLAMRGAPAVVVAGVGPDAEDVLALFRSGASDIILEPSSTLDVVAAALAAAGRRRRQHEASVRSGEGRDVLDLPYKAARESVITAFERAFAAHVMQAFRGNVARSAAATGLSRQSFHALLHRTGVSADDYRQRGNRD